MIKSVYEGKFIEFKVRETDDYRYEFMHESRCDGHIVSVLPVHIDKGMLVRKEYTPCWGDDLYISSITGGWEIARHLTPVDTVIEELREEAGIVLHNEDHIFTLGTCRGSKASDTVYHLFLVDLSNDDYDEVDITTDGSFLEGKAHNEWMPTGLGLEPHDALEQCEWLANGCDPMLYVTYTRWLKGHLHKKAERGDYILG